MSSLTIQERQRHGVVIVDLAGKVTIGESTSYLKDAIRLLVREGKQQVILNLAKVKFIDSSGLGEIVGASTTLKDNNGTLKLVNLPRAVTDLMTITKLYTVFEIYDSEDEGVYSFEDNSDAKRVTQPLDGNIAVNAAAGRSVR